MVDYLEQLRQKITPVTPEVTEFVAAFDRSYAKQFAAIPGAPPGHAIGLRGVANELGVDFNSSEFKSRIQKMIDMGVESPYIFAPDRIAKNNLQLKIPGVLHEQSIGLVTRRPSITLKGRQQLETQEVGNPTVIYGWLTPSLAEELKRLMEVTEWPPPEEPSPTFSAVLQVCDYAFTLKVLKRKTYEMDVGKSGHKKILIVRLLNAEEEEVTDMAQRTIAEMKARGITEEDVLTLEEVTDIARKVVGAERQN